jgi:3-oxoacyl-[acyl-carrier protein] reductase
MVVNVYQVKNKLAVVTGGSSGIGLAIAKVLAEQGFTLLLVARNQQKLDDAAEQISTQSSSQCSSQNSTTVYTASIDVTDIEQVKSLAGKVKEISPCADLIVNSAGIVSGGYLVDTPLEEWDRLYQFNVRGLVSVLQTLIPDMQQQFYQDGEQRHVVNLASAAAYMNTLGMSAYGSTKAGVISFSESLAHELKSENIGVTAVCPEFVKTPIGEKVTLFGRMDHPKAHRQIKKGFENSSITAEQLAEKMLQAVAKNKLLIPMGKQASFLYHFKRLLPRAGFNMIFKSTVGNGNQSKTNKTNSKKVT